MSLQNVDRLLAEKEAVVALFATGRLCESEAAARSLTERFPMDSFGWKALGAVLARQGRSGEALEPLTRATELSPGESDTYNSLGTAQRALGRVDEALPNYQLAVKFNPNYAEAHFNLGNTLTGAGRLHEALACYEHAVQVNPAFAQAHFNLGSTLQDLGRPAEAAASYLKAIAIEPRMAEAHNNLGMVLKQLGRLDEALASFQRAIDARPDYAEAHNNRGVALQGTTRFEEALASYQRALTIAPDFAEAHYNLGMALQESGCLEAAVVSYRRAVELKPDCVAFRSNLLFVEAAAGYADPATAVHAARAWERLVVSELDRAAARSWQFANPSRRHRPLRVGVVSAELGHHAVSYFLTSWMRALPRDRVRLLLYPTTVRREPEAEMIRALADQWTPLSGRSDSDAAAQIRSDQVDILLDTTGHMRDCRLGIFAHRAAPVQCHYVGYFSTTGLSEMDYFLADRDLIPPEFDSHFTETIWRLPRPWVAYAPLRDAPDIAWRPAERGVLRLGSFNKLTKLSKPCLALWAKVLEALPAAELVLKDKREVDSVALVRVVETLERQGVAKDRVRFLPRTTDWSAHMSCYDQLDIALDTVPFGGGTTVFDALWMGVPLITLAGNCLIGRMGAAVLAALGHPEWIARTEDEYVEKVVALARDVERRASLRVNQRERMRAGPLGDGRGMAEALADAFEAMFDCWRARRHVA